MGDTVRPILSGARPWHSLEWRELEIGYFVFAKSLKFSPKYYTTLGAYLRNRAWLF